MACMFCGLEGKLTNEHVFASWIRESFGPVAVSATHVQRLVTSDGDERRRHRATRMLEIKGRRFCATCNSGWMRELDNEVRPALEPLLHDEPTLLSPLDQDILSVWATKIVLVWQAINIRRTPVVPDAHYPWFYERRRPLPGSQVWLLRYTDHSAWPFVTHQWGGTFAPPGCPPPQHGDPLNGFSAVFTLGFVGVWILDVDVPGGPYTPGHSDDQLRAIWPVTGADALWPPARPVDTDQELGGIPRRLLGGSEAPGLKVEAWQPNAEAE